MYVLKLMLWGWEKTVVLISDRFHPIDRVWIRGLQIMKTMTPKTLDLQAKNETASKFLIRKQNSYLPLKKKHI